MRITHRLSRLLLALALLPLWMAACQPPTPAPPMPESRQTIRYLALGDSYTIGESVPEAGRWPVQLAALLENENIATDLTIIARTGWTTDELWAAIQQRGVQPPYDLVSLLIGVNNQYRGRSPETYREDFRFLLGKAIEYAGGDPGRVLVLSIPDWSVTPFGKLDPRGPAQIAAEINAFNAINREETEKAGARYIDITPISRDAQADQTLLAADGLHPSADMYAAWAQAALPAVRAALGRGP